MIASETDPNKICISYDKHYQFKYLDCTLCTVVHGLCVYKMEIVCVEGKKNTLRLEMEIAIAE